MNVDFALGSDDSDHDAVNTFFLDLSGSIVGLIDKKPDEDEPKKVLTAEATMRGFYKLPEGETVSMDGVFEEGPYFASQVFPLLSSYFSAVLRHMGVPSMGFQLPVAINFFKAAEAKGEQETEKPKGSKKKK